MRKNGLLLILLIFGMFSVTIAQSDDPVPVPAAELADDNGQFISVDGVELYYIEAGPADGPAVMLLHGFGGSTFTWRDTIPALADAGYRVIAYDRPPYGLSQKSADLDISSTAYADQLAGLMDALEIDTATLVGHSAGGGVVGHFAITYPQRVQAMVYVAGAITLSQAENTDTARNGSALGGLGDFAEALDPNSPFARQLVRSFLTPEQFTDILASAYHPSFDVTDDIREGYSRVLQVEDWEVGFLALLAGGDPAQDTIDAEVFSTLEQPTLIIWGEDDAWVPIEQGEVLRDLLPQAQWVTLPQVGHLPMEEDVDGFNTALIRFLSGVTD